MGCVLDDPLACAAMFWTHYTLYTSDAPDQNTRIHLRGSMIMVNTRTIIFMLVSILYKFKNTNVHKNSQTSTVRNNNM